MTPAVQPWAKWPLVTRMLGLGRVVGTARRKGDAGNRGRPVRSEVAASTPAWTALPAGAGTNRLWPIVCEFPEFAYAVVLRGRPGLRFTGTAGAAATTLPLVLALALRLVPLVGSTVATSIVSTLAGFAATISITLTLAGSGAITSIVPVTASIAAALAGGAAARFPRSPNPKFFANADRCAA
jgi:hypothetical protein